MVFRSSTSSASQSYTPLSSGLRHGHPLFHKTGLVLMLHKGYMGDQLKDEAGCKDEVYFLSVI